MPDPENLAARVRALLAARTDVVEHEFSGGVGWAIRGNVACGTQGQDLIVRLDGEQAYRALDDPHVRPMAFQGPIARAFVKVDAVAVAGETELARWVHAGVAFVATLPPG
jgi:hypothetical protein